MITRGIIKMNRNVEDADFIAGITRKVDRDDTVENSEAIKKEIVELADKIRTVGIREFNSYFYCQINKDEFIALGKPLLIKNGDLEAEVIPFGNKVTYKITDGSGNIEHGAVFFNRAAFGDNKTVKELESLTKIYIYLISEYKGSDKGDVIRKVESELKFLIMRCSDYMINITAEDINRIKFHINSDVIKAIKSLI